MTYLEQAIRDAVEKGGYEPYRHHFIDLENESKELAPKPYLIELSTDGHEHFECPHSTIVMHWSEDDDARVNWENNELAFSTDKMLLDPAFWQALGKARGWLAQVMRKCPVKDCIECTFTDEETYCRKHGHLMVLTAYVHKSEEWLKNWHRLIDHLAAGKDVESFFEELK